MSNFTVEMKRDHKFKHGPTAKAGQTATLEEAHYKELPKDSFKLVSENTPSVVKANPAGPKG